MAKEPGDRYASCGQFADTLRGALGLQPYRSGPRVMSAGIHPLTETVWPETLAAAQHGGNAADGAAALSPVPDPADASATETSVPVAPDAISGAGQFPVSSDGGQAQPHRRLWRLIVISAFVLAAVGLAAGLLVGSPAHTTTVPISLKSALPAVSGDVYVVYLGGKKANAEVYGEIQKAANGEVAELYAQQFPYKNPPARAGSIILRRAGATARYEFRITPTLATRYRVDLFQSSSSSMPFAISQIVTIYVSLNYATGNVRTCSRPICRELLQTTILAPPSAVQTEMSKPLNVYFGLNLARAKEPAPPQWLSLGAGNGAVVTSHRISADKFSETVNFVFGIGNDAYRSAWAMCLKDTEAEDGIGLPGHHGCGDPRVLQSASYLG